MKKTNLTLKEKLFGDLTEEQIINVIKNEATLSTTLDNGTTLILTTLKNIQAVNKETKMNATIKGFAYGMIFSAGFHVVTKLFKSKENTQNEKKRKIHR